jgi:hypothetical protein
MLPPPPVKSEPPWYQRGSAVALLIIFIPIVGVVLLLMNPRWSVARKLLILGAISLFLVPAFMSAASPQPTTSPPVSTSYR